MVRTCCGRDDGLAFTLVRLLDHWWCGRLLNLGQSMTLDHAPVLGQGVDDDVALVLDRLLDP